MRKAAARDDVMNVRVIDELASPRVKDTDHPDASADEPWIESELL
jgi:hypothetical protein